MKKITLLFFLVGLFATAQNTLNLNLINSYHTGVFDESAAETAEEDEEDLGLDLTGEFEALGEGGMGAETSDDMELDLGDDLDLGGDEEGQVELETDQEAGLELDDAEEPAIAAGDDDFDISELSEDIDEVSTKLDLAKAYIDMGDNDGARDILEEVKAEGNDAQKQEAEALLEQAG